MLPRSADGNTRRPQPTAHFEVTVTRATNGKPVENASVIFHPLQDGHDDGNMELKTNDEGKAALDLLEVGTNVRLQIIAPGFQTYGEDFKVDKGKPHRRRQAEAAGRTIFGLQKDRRQEYPRPERQARS